MLHTGVVVVDVGGVVCRREKAIQVNKGPNENFGLEAPTPGFGHEWKRDRSEELATQKYSKDLSYLEKYDRYSSSK